MIFEHSLLDLPDLTTVNEEGKRFYVTPEGKHYPSVTTVLSKMKDDSFLVEWKKRVGEQEAQAIMTKASRRGTAVHELCEKLLLNQEIDYSQHMPNQVDLFKQLRSTLEQSVNKVYAIEAALYSDRLKIAGRVDGIVEFNGVPSIIDFKTSLKQKRKEWIKDYFMQATLYSCMIYDMIGFKVPQIVIYIAVESGDYIDGQLFIENTSSYVADAVKTVKNYHNLVQ